jgi:hypothetical protein
VLLVVPDVIRQSICLGIDDLRASQNFVSESGMLDGTRPPSLSTLGPRYGLFVGKQSVCYELLVAGHVRRGASQRMKVFISYSRRDDAPVSASGPEVLDQESGSATKAEDRGTALVPPAEATPAADGVPFAQRLSRRTKIVFGRAAAFVVAAITVVAIVLGSQSCSWVGSMLRSTATPTVTISSDPVQQLIGMVPSGDSCVQTTNAPRSSGAEVAEVDCENARPLSSLMYFLFPDSSTLQSWINKIPPGGFQPCPGMDRGPQPWHHAANPQQIEGMVACYSSNGHPTLTWSEDSRLLGGVAVGSSIDRVYRWWAAQYQ